MAHFEPANIGFFLLLVTSILISVISVLLPRFYQQLVRERSHNAEKLWNECLARTQLQYIAFYIAIEIQAPSSPGWERLIFVPMLMSFIFWTAGLKREMDQDNLITALHECDPAPPEVCKRGELTPMIRWHVLGRNIILSIISFAIALCFTFSSLPLQRDEKRTQHVSAGLDAAGRHPGATVISGPAKITCTKADSDREEPGYCRIEAPGYAGTVGTGQSVSANAAGTVLLNCEGQSNRVMCAITIRE